MIFVGGVDNDIDDKQTHQIDDGEIHNIRVLPVDKFPNEAHVTYT
jgi:hypothetical protein